MKIPRPCNTVNSLSQGVVYYLNCLPTGTFIKQETVPFLLNLLRNDPCALHLSDDSAVTRTCFLFSTPDFVSLSLIYTNGSIFSIFFYYALPVATKIMCTEVTAPYILCRLTTKIFYQINKPAFDFYEYVLFRLLDDHFVFCLDLYILYL